MITEQIVGLRARSADRGAPVSSGIIQHRWTRRQIILGEVQRFVLRVRTNPIFFGYMAVNAVNEKQYGLMDVLLENFLEELAGPRTHVDVMMQFLEKRPENIHARERPSRGSRPRNHAAVDDYRVLPKAVSLGRGRAVKFRGEPAGGPDRVSSKVYRELTGHYGFSPRAAGDQAALESGTSGHGERQIEVIRRYAVDADTQEKVRRAVKLGVTAFTLEWMVTFRR